MSNYQNFTSLPPDKEQQFIVYEQRKVEDGKRATMIALITAAIFGIVTVIVVKSFPPPKNKMAEDDMGMLSRSKKDADKAKTPDPPAKATPAEASSEGGEAPSEGSEAPSEGSEAPSEGSATPSEGSAAPSEAAPSESEE